MGGEVVAYQAYPLGLWVDLLRQAPDHLGELLAAAPLGDLDLPPAGKRLEGHQHVCCAPSLLLVVAALEAARSSSRKRIEHVRQQLAGSLVQADEWEERVLGLFVEVEHGLHTPHENAAALSLGGITHPFTRWGHQVGAELVFLSVLRTVSWETEGTIPSSSAFLSAKRRMLQRSRPSGASEQASAISLASARPSSERS